MQHTMSSLAQLPYELLLLIFSFAAAESLHAAVSLTFLSSDVRKSTAQYLYRTVQLSSGRQVDAFLSILLGYSERPRSLSLMNNPAYYVRNLCVTHHAFGSSADPLSTIFEYCCKVENVALQSTLLHSSLVPGHSIHRLHCADVTIFGPTWPSDWKRHARESDLWKGRFGQAPGDKLIRYQSLSYVNPTTTLLSHTTHLRLIDTVSSPHLSIPHLCSLPNLSHVAVKLHEQNFNNDPFAELKPLFSAPNLVMIIAVFNFRVWKNKKHSLDEWAYLAQRRSNGRLFVLDGTDEDAVSEWVGTVKGEENIWARARREHDSRPLCS